jgi:hypothetical protein
LLNLELWFRTFVDRGGVQTLPEPSLGRTLSGRDARSDAAAPRPGAASPRHEATT